VPALCASSILYMGDNIEIDVSRFQQRVQQLKDHWAHYPWPLDALVICTGKPSETDAVEHKAKAMNHWLLGYEFTETAIGILRSGMVIFLTSSSKLKYLGKVEGPNVKLIARKKEDELGAISSFMSHIAGSSSQVKVGTLIKETHAGQWAQDFVKQLSTRGGFQVVDCREEVSMSLAPKTETEVVFVKNAAKLVQLMMSECFWLKLETVIDQELRKKVDSLCAEVEQEMDKEETVQRWQKATNLDPADMELIYVSLQSGRHFDLKPGVEPTSEEIPMEGCYVLSLGMKYAEYSACAARTLLVDPTKIQKEAYQLSLEIQQIVIANLRPGVSFKDIYNTARQTVQNKQPHLVNRFVKNVGFLMGLEFKDPQGVLQERSNRRVESGMVFCVAVGFHDATPGTSWAVWLADTAIVPQIGNAHKPCEIPTSEINARPDAVMYELDPTNGEPPPQATPGAQGRNFPNGANGDMSPPKAPPASKAKAKGKGKAKAKALPVKEEKKEKKKEKKEFFMSEPLLTTQTRSHHRVEQAQEKIAEIAEMERKQTEFRRKKFEELQKRFEGVDDRDHEVKLKRLDECQAYAGPDEIPDLKQNRMQVDLTNEALLVPVCGFVVPFHVRTIKNITRSESGRAQLLRVNFFRPGQGMSQDQFPELNGVRLYFQEMTFKSDSRENFDTVIRVFKEAQKRIKQNDLESEVRKGASDSAQPQTIQLSRSNFPVLREVNLRPTPGGRQRAVGTLEAHPNGFRYRPKSGGEQIDVLYSKIRHAIFQPHEGNAMMICLHLHLKENIMVGKKKTGDVQFFTQTVDMTEDLTQHKGGSIYDPDEINEEDRQRERIQHLNKVFQDFCQKVERMPGFAQSSLKFDVPYKELEFTGVPFKGTVAIQPCTNALVSLVEWPPFVVDLGDIDIVVFERDLLSVREFDMVFVYKDYDKLPSRITMVSKKHQEKIKAWLAELEMPWYSCTLNLSWAPVMKQITSSPQTFLETGGWDAWFGREEEDEDEDKQTSSSDFEDSAVDSDDDEDDDDDDDFTDGEESSRADDDDDGESWDELERKAEMRDRKTTAAEGAKRKAEAVRAAQQSRNKRSRR